MRKLIAAATLLAMAVTGLPGPVGATPDEDAIRMGRALLGKEYPQALRNLARNDGFGGPVSPLLATRMQDRSPELVAEARRLMTVEPRGKGMWLIRFPYVNVVLVETNTVRGPASCPIRF